MGRCVGVLALTGYALAPSLGVLWPAALALGAANASIDVGLGAFISTETPLASRAAAQAGWNAVTGARGIAAAFVISGLLSLGLVTVTSGLLVCAASATVGAVLFFRVRPTPAPGVDPFAAGAVRAAQGAALDTAMMGLTPNETAEPIGA